MKLSVWRLDGEVPANKGGPAAITDDVGKTWKLLDIVLPFRSGVAGVKDRWFAVGTSGSHDSADNADR